MSKGWDNITLKKLKALVGKGLSTSEMGKRLGMSKNAVVGKLNRLGWNAKAGSVATSKNVPAKSKKTPVKPTAKTPATPKTKVATKKIAAKSTAKKTPAKPATKKVAVSGKSKKAPAKVTTKVTQSKQTKTSSKTSAKNLAMHQRIIQHSLEMANLKPNQCRWPIGDPDSENFHFCGKTVFTGKPYCYEHCRLAYQFTPPKKKQ